LLSCCRVWCFLALSISVKPFTASARLDQAEGEKCGVTLIMWGEPVTVIFDDHKAWALDRFPLASL